MLNNPSANLEKKRIRIFSNTRKRITFYVTLSVNGNFYCGFNNESR